MFSHLCPACPWLGKSSRSCLRRGYGRFWDTGRDDGNQWGREKPINTEVATVLEAVCTQLHWTSVSVPWLQTKLEREVQRQKRSGKPWGLQHTLPTPAPLSPRQLFPEQAAGVLPVPRARRLSAAQAAGQGWGCVRRGPSACSHTSAVTSAEGCAGRGSGRAPGAVAAGRRPPWWGGRRHGRGSREGAAAAARPRSCCGAAGRGAPAEGPVWTAARRRRRRR